MKVIFGNWLVNNSNQYCTIDLVSGKINFKKIDFFRKVLFLDVTYITSDIASNTSNVCFCFNEVHHSSLIGFSIKEKIDQG